MNSDTRIIAQTVSDEEKSAICEPSRVKNVILNTSIRESVGTQLGSQEDES